MYACMYICMYVCMYHTYMYVCTYVEDEEANAVAAFTEMEVKLGSTGALPTMKGLSPNDADDVAVVVSAAAVVVSVLAKAPPKGLSAAAVVHTYIHTYIQREHTYIHREHTRIHTYIHTYIHTFMHTYIHTYILFLLRGQKDYQLLLCLLWFHLLQITPLVLLWPWPQLRMGSPLLYGCMLCNVVSISIFKRQLEIEQRGANKKNYIVCMCACMMYVCINVYMYVCLSVCLYVCICMHVCLFVCMRMCVRVYACMYVCVYVCTCVHVCMYVYMYVCIVCMYRYVFDASTSF